jgi:hypothetical protein
MSPIPVLLDSATALPRGCTAASVISVGSRFGVMANGGH